MTGTIFTIGHSTRSIGEFLATFHSFDIEMLADIRSFPISKRYPQFNKLALEQSLSDSEIKYIHLRALGGRREPLTYTEHMEANEFKQGIIDLEALASTHRVVYMCSEADWRRCHRSLVSDHLKLRGWDVIHIVGESKSEEHQIRAKQGSLF
jgi:uncharacterized protein (DUF488 family)